MKTLAVLAILGCVVSGVFVGKFIKRHAFLYLIVFSIVLCLAGNLTITLQAIQLPFFDALQGIILWNVIPWFVFCFLPSLLVFYVTRKFVLKNNTVSIMSSKSDQNNKS